MSRSAFGLWGVELDDKTFAMALAMLGLRASIGDGRQWLYSLNPHSIYQLLRQNDSLLDWRFPDADAPPLLPAQDMAEMWKFAVAARGPIRLAVNDGANRLLPWVLGQLCKADGVGSVFQLAYDAEDPLAWSWPLRVALFADDESIPLAGNLKSSWAAARLPALATIAPVADNARSNLLLLPWPLKRSLQEVMASGAAIRTDFVMVLGGHRGPWGEQYSLLGALRTQVRAGGACSVRLDSTQQRDVFNSIVVNLSHDLALDQSIHRALGNKPYLLQLSNGLLSAARLTEVAARLATHYVALPPSKAPAAVPPVIAHYFLKSPSKVQTPVASPTPGPPAEKPLAGSGGPFEGYFDYENRGASDIAMFSQSLEQMSEESPPLSRYVQSQIFLADMDYSPARKAMVKGQKHLAVIRIGPVEGSWLSPARDAVFPDQLLPDDLESNLLEVAFVEPRHLDAPIQQTIRLPKEGPSSTCQFLFETNPEFDDFAARIIIRHKNRVLQTALLTARITEDGSLPDGAQPLSIAIESVVRQNLTGLTGRPEFGLAVVANHDAQGAPGVTLLREGQVKYLYLRSMDTTLALLRDKLAEIADFQDSNTWDQASNDLEELLLFLAVHGSMLFQGIVLDQLGEAPEKDMPVQVVSAREEAFFPIEFFYDRPCPDQKSHLCPKAAQCLENGASEVCTMFQENGTSPVICPLGFWCLSRVIERHAFDVKASSCMSGADFGLYAEPSTNRDTLFPFKTVLFGASERVDSVTPDLRQQTFDFVKARSDNQFMVDDWVHWQDAVTKHEPSLLLLMPHTYLDARSNCPAMEIGPEESESLLAARIREGYVAKGNSSIKPIVLLLGCSTGVSPKPFEGFVPHFRTKAAIVVSTLATVLGRHVVPVAKLLIKELGNRDQPEGILFGEALRSARCKALLEGQPMALCLVAYGDASWRIHCS